MFHVLTRVMKTTSVFASGLLMCVLMASFLMFAVPVVWSQPFDSSKVSLYAWIKPGDVGASGGNDCWGYTSPSGREYALMGFNNKITIIEISDPANPVIVKSIGHSDSLWGDVKVYQNFCYVVNESGGGIQAIDLSNIDSGQAVLVSSFGPGASHNIAINETSGFLYAVGSSLNGGRPVAYDLRTNPGNPTEAGRISGQQGSYIHDAQIVTMTDGREIMFGASEGRGVDIYDVSNKQIMLRLSRTTYPGLSYCHQMWTNDDHTLLYVDDELDELNGRAPTTRTLVFDVSDLTNPVLVNTFTTGLPATDHNLYFNGGIIYEANYTTGLRIFDARNNPIDPTEVGFFDTYPESNGLGFAGAWNVYPFFPSGTVIVSDLNRGLFILDVSKALTGLNFIYPNGRPDLIDPAGGTSFMVQVTNRGIDPQPDTGVLHYNDGSGWMTTPMFGNGTNDYDAVFPATQCGQIVQYYVSAETVNGDVETDPPTAPDAVFTALSAVSVTTLSSDDFETDTGWVVKNTNVSEGGWERGLPAGDGTRGDPTSDYDGSGQCYLTGLSINKDLDGGPTVLTSPVIDLSAGDAMITYAKWFFNDDNDADSIITEVSNDGGASWVFVEETVSGAGGWFESTFRVSDFVVPSATVQVRFSASDQPNDSVTEVGVDAFRVERAVCANDCLNLVSTSIVAGQSADFTVTGGAAGARAVVLYGFQPGQLQFCQQGQPWCVDFGIDIPLSKATKRVVVQGTFDGSGIFTDSRIVPSGTTGTRILMQAAESDTFPDVCMSNILDVVIQ